MTDRIGSTLSRVASVKIAVILIAVFAMSVGALADAAPVDASGGTNLLTNGSFEEGDFTVGASPTLAPGSTAITGWTVGDSSPDNIDWIGTLWVASEGVRSIDMNGYHPATLSQSFATTDENTYAVEFDMAGNMSCDSNEKSVTVTAGSVTETFTFDTDTYSFGNMGWTQKSFTFVANDVTSTLKFESFHSGACGPAIDNVKVSAGFEMFGHHNNTSSLWQINKSNGNYSIVGPTGHGTGASGMATSRAVVSTAIGSFVSGTHWGLLQSLDVNDDDEDGSVLDLIDKVYVIDTTTGQATPVVITSRPIAGRGIDFGADGKTLYVIEDSNGGTGQKGPLSTIDLHTGVVTHIAYTGRTAASLEWDPDRDEFLAVDGGGRLVSITETGDDTLIKTAFGIVCTLTRDPLTDTWYTIYANRLHTFDEGTGIRSLVLGIPNNLGSVCGTAFAPQQAAVPINSAPSIVVPDDVEIEATGPTGAGGYDRYIGVSATDNEDDAEDLTIVCLPNLSVFPFTATTIICTATDTGGATDVGTYTITAIDTTPPSIDSTPSDVVAPATGPGGAVVIFDAPSASDIVDQDVAVSCVPASGTLFALGDTLVTCTAIDDYSNSSEPVTFTVTVYVPLVIDVKPDGDVDPENDVNPLNLNGNGVVPIAILGSADFDVTLVDPDSVVAMADDSTIDPALPVHSGHIEDVNGDGFDDYVFHFREYELGATDATETIVLSAFSSLGGLSEAEDAVRINPNNPKSKGKGGKGPK